MNRCDEALVSVEERTAITITAETLYRLDRLRHGDTKPYGKTIMGFVKCCFADHARIQIKEVRIV